MEDLPRSLLGVLAPLIPIGQHLVSLWLFQVFLAITCIAIGLSAISQFLVNKAAHSILIDVALVHDKQFHFELDVAFSRPFELCAGAQRYQVKSTI